MATLEKIRKKSVLLLVIIGAALIAFIIGDFLNSGRSIFGNATTVANVDGEKIDYMQYQQRYSALTENNQQMRDTDPAIIQNQVLDQMIGEILLNEEYDALGIDVSDSELSDYMFKYMLRQDQNFAQSLQYLLQATQAPVELKDPSKPEQLVQDFHAFIFNPAKFGRQEDEIIAQAKAWWLSNEQNAVEQLKQMKFGRLFGSMVAANDLDRAALNADMANSYTVRMVAVPYSSLDDKDYKVGEAEIKAVYEKEKERFALKNEVRRVHYIAVAISPSKADNEKADKFMEEVDSTLHATEGVEGIRHYSELTIAETEARDQDLARATIALKNFVDTAAVGQISPITRNGDDRIIYRLLAKKQAVDSVHITRATVMGNKAMQDSVIALLNGGKSLDELANDSTVSKLEENMPLDLIASVAQGVITEDMRSQMLSAGNDFFIQQSEDEGALICRVDSKSAPKTVYEAATITYTVTASKDTRNDLFSDLQKYVDANNTAKAFVENATKSSRNYSVMTVNIDETTPALGSQYNYVKSSSKMIQWLFKEAKEGQVSAIQGDNDQYLVAALDKVYDGDYLPLEDPDVKKYCETQARNEKKGDALVKKYAGKANDIDGYAKLLGKPVQTQRVGGGMPAFEPALGGQVPYAEVGKVYGPVKGVGMVFVYTVDKKEEAANAIENDRLDAAFVQQYAMFGNLLQILENNKDVENNIINFR